MLEIMDSINQQKESPSQSQRLLWWACGATPSILVQCPTDYKKYAAIGAAMLLIPLVAAISAGFAIMQTFEFLPVAVLGGLGWGTLIFTVDRLLLISLRKEEGNRRKEFFMALPRLLMIVVLSILITDPLLHRFFEREVNYQLTRETQQAANEAKATAQARYGGEIDALESDNERLANELKAKKEFRDSKFNELMAEGEGTGGTRRPGKGAFYQEKKMAYEKAAQDYDEEKGKSEASVEQNNAHIKEMKQRLDEIVERATKDKDNAKGLLARNSALFTIIRHDLGAAMIFILLSLALILLESTPLTIKLFSKRGHYDECLERYEQERIFEEKQKLEERKTIIKQEADGRVDSAEQFLKLKKDTLGKITVAILSDDQKNLAADKIEVVKALSAYVKNVILDEIPGKPSESDSRRGAVTANPIPLPEKPVSLVVQIHEPEEESFIINFNRIEAEVKGHDLLFALPEIDSEFLPRSESRQPLVNYHVVNDEGVDINPDEALIEQLNGSRVVHLLLNTQTVSEAEN
jgi:hypothetical protein